MTQVPNHTEIEMTDKVAARSITVPDTCLIMLVGASNSGKSTFAQRHFHPTEIVSSDHYRMVVSGTNLDMSASADAFSLLHQIVDFRLKRGLLTVVDSTNVVREHRKQLMDIARRNCVETIAIAFDTPLSVCIKRAAARTEHPIPPDVVRNQYQQLQRDIRRLHRFVKTEVVAHDEVVQINRSPLAVDFKHLSGPFNIIGDIHGCYTELLELMEKLPKGMPIFVGDLVDRGPQSPRVIRYVCDLVDNHHALWSPGNHDNKLYRYLSGHKVTISHGLQDTIDQLDALPESERTQLVEDFKRIFKSLPSHLVLDNGKLVVAHAGLPEHIHGRDVKSVYSAAMYGETTGKLDAEGLPDRIDWAAEYRGRRLVVYGHSAYKSPRWLNNTVNIDTGCVFGGSLTALAYPSNETISVRAKRIYHPYGKPLPDPVGEYDDILDLSDVLGRKSIHTQHDGMVKISDWKAAAAFETMITAGIDPRLMVYLPPTMSPCETSSQTDYLEHPLEAVEYFAKRGVNRVVFEEKHMGSRAVALICRNEQAALERFGVKTLGTVYTRTGRPFFDGDEQLALVESLHADLTLANVWNQYETDWILLDGELMPWSAKAGGLLTRTYASTAMAGKYLSAAVAAELTVAAESIDDANLRNDLSRWDRLQGHMEKFRNAYLNYCWKVSSVADLMYAPFALLATEGRTHFDVPNVQQMATFASWRGRIISPTSFLEVDVANPENVDQAVELWTNMTEAGGEGMVIKPYDPITKFDNRTVQPGVKCRGREYLRIIYGPDYTENLDRLRRRNLSGKRANAIREYALGIEGLNRFVVREPLRRVHECVFGVLALESDPIDPRL